MKQHITDFTRITVTSDDVAFLTVTDTSLLILW